MPDRNTDMGVQRRQPALQRRQILAATAGLAGLTGLAGCSGGDGGGGDGGGGDGGGGGGGAQDCTDITSGYDSQDGGERPLLVNFEYPELFDQIQFNTTSVQVTAGAERELPEDFINFSLLQQVDTESDAGEVPPGDTSTVTEFNGEEVEFAGTTGDDRADFFGNLPYQVDGERKRFRAQVGLAAQTESGACGDALLETAEHVIGSFELNEETTLGE